MSNLLPRLQDLLLDMLGTHREIDPSLPASLRQNDWQAIMKTVEQHRLAPLLYWRLTHEHADLPTPAEVRSQLEREFKASAMRGLLLQRELILIHRLLEQARIPYAALKGAYLAYSVYPHTALRPLRDLDLIVPKERALEAFSVLLEGGLIRHELSRGNPEAALEHKKHLPPVLTSQGSIWVELHTRLSDSENHDLASRDIWNRTIPRKTASDSVNFLSPTDQLFHLIIHAVYDHKFSNGPLTLSDLFYLIQNDVIDWGLFWESAMQLHVTQGCVLALKMTERYYGTMDIDWGEIGEMPDGSVVEKATRLMLRDYESQGFSNLKSARFGEDTFPGKVGVYVSRLFPSKVEIASRYPVSVNSIRVYFWYPVWWAYVLQRVWQNVIRRNKSGLGDEADNLLRVESWLKD